MLAVMVNISIAGTYGDKPRFKLIYLVNNVIPNLPMMDVVRKLEKKNAHTGRCSSIQKHYQTVLSLKHWKCSRRTDSRPLVFLCAQVGLDLGSLATYESVEMKRCERRKRTLVLSKLTSSDAITVGAKRRPLFAPLIWSGLYLCGQVMCVCVKSGRPFEAALVVHLMLSRKRLPVHRMSSSRCSHNSRGCVSGRARSTCLDRKRSGGGGMFQLEVGKLLM